MKSKTNFPGIAFNRWNVVKLLVSAAILIVIISRLQQSRDIVQVLLSIDLLWLLPAAGAALLHFVLSYLRWSFALRSIGSLKVTAAQIWRSLIGGVTLGLITPGGIGELARGIIVDTENFWEVSGISVIDKGFAHMIALFLGIAGMAVLGMAQFSLTLFQLVLIYGVLALLSIVAVMVLFRPDVSGNVLLRISRKLPRRFEGWLHPLGTQMQNLTRRQTAFMLTISLIINCGVFLEFFLFLRAFTPAAVWETFWAFEVAYLGTTLLPISFSNLGVQEGLRILVIGLTGVPATAIFHASLLVFTSNVLIPGIIGYFFIAKIRLPEKYT